MKFLYIMIGALFSVSVSAGVSAVSAPVVPGFTLTAAHPSALASYSTLGTNGTSNAATATASAAIIINPFQFSMSEIDGTVAREEVGTNVNGGIGNASAGVGERLYYYKSASNDHSERWLQVTFTWSGTFTAIPGDAPPKTTPTATLSIRATESVLSDNGTVTDSPSGSVTLNHTASQWTASNLSGLNLNLNANTGYAILDGTYTANIAAKDFFVIYINNSISTEVLYAIGAATLTSDVSVREISAIPELPAWALFVGGGVALRAIAVRRKSLIRRTSTA